MLSKTVGSYKIIEKIAFGGMGVVYKGIHTKLEQFVAIKVLSPQFATNQIMKSKFLSEAKIQAQLSHPNVVNIINFIGTFTLLSIIISNFHFDRIICIYAYSASALHLYLRLRRSG